MTGPERTAPHDPDAQTPMGRWRALGEAFLLMAVLAVTAAVAASNLPSSTRSMPLVPLIAYGTAIAVMAGLLMLNRHAWRRLGFGWPRKPLTTAVTGIALGGVIVVAYVLTLNLLVKVGQPSLNIGRMKDLVEGNTSVYIAWMVLAVWGSAAFGEELMFRGFILNRLESVFAGLPMPFLWAVLGQAAVFSSRHAYQGPTGMILSGIVGLILGLAFYAARRNLWVSIIAHGIVDSTAFTLLYLGRIKLLIPS